VPDRGRRMPPLGQPLVSSVSRAAELLKVDADRLAQGVKAAQLEPWPWRHADGSLVYPWDALCRVAADLGATIPAKLGHFWRHESGERGRANRKHKAKER
jgi:hypothetical protein